MVGNGVEWLRTRTGQNTHQGGTREGATLRRREACTPYRYPSPYVNRYRAREPWLLPAAIAVIIAPMV